MPTRITKIIRVQGAQLLQPTLHTNRQRWYACCMGAAKIRIVVAYYRVSTDRQRRSGLGIDAQKAAVARFAEAEGLSIIAEFSEAETGKGADALDRPIRLSFSDDAVEDAHDI